VLAARTAESSTWAGAAVRLGLAAEVQAADFVMSHQQVVECLSLVRTKVTGAGSAGWYLVVPWLVLYRFGQRFAIYHHVAGTSVFTVSSPGLKDLWLLACQDGRRFWV
jgi:hypothetical protein